MVLTTINPKLVPLALDAVGPAEFERFAQAFYSALVGRSFVPLGGMHDGGAEGYIEPELFEDRTRHFLQVSKQKDTGVKIRQTVRRLREFGRDPASLTYITSQVVDHIDLEEESLSDDLSCRIRIRDAKYIENQINTSEATVAAYQAHLGPAIEYLRDIGTAPLANRFESDQTRTIAVFLRQEVDHRRGRSDLLESVADTLILWALSETDPDNGKFLSRDEIARKIEGALPSAKRFIRGVLDHRLEQLYIKDGVSGRQIQYHKRVDGFCLPYETRQAIAAENVEDGALKVSVSEILRRRALEVDNTLLSGVVDDVVAVCHATFERIFERQGLQVAQFAIDGDQDDDLYGNVADLVPLVIGELQTISNDSELRRICLAVLRGTFYNSTENERAYLGSGPIKPLAAGAIG